MRSNCSQVFQKCGRNDDEFDCCLYFGEIDSEMGVCFAINSIRVRDKKVKWLSTVSNIKKGPGSLYLGINGFANVYILGDQEVPSLTTLTTDVMQVTPHIHYHRFLAIKGTR